MLDQRTRIAGTVPDHDLGLMRPEQSRDARNTTLLTGLGRVMDAEKPDWAVGQGDTATAMAGPLATNNHKIPVAHVEAGLRSGNIHHPWPEEVNRKIIGAIAALHAAPTQTAADALLRENLDPSTVHVTGNTVIDVLYWIIAKSAADPSLIVGLAALEPRFAGKRIICLTRHRRRENFGEGMAGIAQGVRRIAARIGVAAIFPVHLNSEVCTVMQADLAGLDNVALIEPLEYPHFARVIAMSTLMLTDRGGLQEETPALGKLVPMMRETTEQPVGVEVGTARQVGTEADRIVAETFRLLNDADEHAAISRARNPFGAGRASERIVALLAHDRARRNATVDLGEIGRNDDALIEFVGHLGASCRPHCGACGGLERKETQARGGQRRSRTDFAQKPAEAVRQDLAAPRHVAGNQGPRHRRGLDQRPRCAFAIRWQDHAMGSGKVGSDIVANPKIFDVSFIQPGLQRRRVDRAAISRGARPEQAEPCLRMHRAHPLRRIEVFGHALVAQQPRDQKERRGAGG